MHIDIIFICTIILFSLPIWPSNYVCALFCMEFPNNYHVLAMPEKYMIDMFFVSFLVALCHFISAVRPSNCYNLNIIFFISFRPYVSDH